MIKNKYISILLTVLNVVYLLILTFINDPFEYNYSMYTSTIKGYILVFGLCILLGINFLNDTYLIDKKKSIIALLAPIVGCIFPYRAHVGDILSNLHEIFAYLSLGLTLYITFNNLEKYKSYNYKIAKNLETLLIVIFLIDGILYFDNFHVASIHETILLIPILLIHLYCLLKIISKEL